MITSPATPAMRSGSSPPPLPLELVGVAVGTGCADAVAEACGGLASADAGAEAVGAADGPATWTPCRITFWYGLPLVITGSAWLTNWREASKRCQLRRNQHSDPHLRSGTAPRTGRRLSPRRADRTGSQGPCRLPYSSSATAAHASLERSFGRSRNAPVTSPSMRSGRKVSGTSTLSVGLPFVATLMPRGARPCFLAINQGRVQERVVCRDEQGRIEVTLNLIGCWPGLSMRVWPTGTTFGPFGSIWTTLIVRTAWLVSCHGSV